MDIVLIGLGGILLVTALPFLAWRYRSRPRPVASA
jgi:hypothetical protein